MTIAWTLTVAVAAIVAGLKASSIALIGVTFLAGAVYLSAESIREVAGHAHSEHSVAGTTIAAAALVVIALLAVSERRAGKLPMPPRRH